MTGQHELMSLAEEPARPRAAYSERVQQVCDRLGYRDCPLCGVYCGPMHLGSTKLWELWERRADNPRGVDPVSGWSLGKIREHLALIRAAGLAKEGERDAGAR